MPQTSRERVLVAIPVYNEIRYVEQVLEKVLRFHGDLLVIDDGSSDGTAELLSARTDIQLIRHPRNLGYGRSLIDSFELADHAGYDWVITMDCDEQHEPEMIPAFKRYIAENRWDVISGSRYVEPRTDDDLPPGDRRAINQTITARLNELYNFGITDAFCGFKAHRVCSMLSLQLDESGYAFPLQFWPRVARAGLRVREIPVRLIYNDPNRHFGGDLDDAGKRLRHYLDVLDHEVSAAGAARSSKDQPASSSCCCPE